MQNCTQIQELSNCEKGEAVSSSHVRYVRTSHIKLPFFKVSSKGGARHHLSFWLEVFCNHNFKNVIRRAKPRYLIVASEL